MPRIAKTLRILPSPAPSVADILERMINLARSGSCGANVDWNEMNSLLDESYAFGPFGDELIDQHISAMRAALVGRRDHVDRCNEIIGRGEQIIKLLT
jgi:hypothetical protein